MSTTGERTFHDGQEHYDAAVSASVIGVRHGEVHNPGGVIYSGLAGFGLSDLGREQARAAGEALRGVGVVAVYASPLDRAIQTATCIADVVGRDLVADERLSEWRYWEQFAGLTWDELRTKARGAWDAYTTDPGAVTTGESLEELAGRVESFLADVAERHDAGLVVAVSHLEPLRAVLLQRLGRPFRDLFSIEIGLGAAVRLAPAAEDVPLSGEDLRRAVM